MKKAFTMMEMVLVMAVVVSLFLLTIPNIKNSMNLVHDKSCDAQLKVIDAAIIQYYLNNDKEAVVIDDLINDGFITERQSRCADGTQIKVKNGQASK